MKYFPHCGSLLHASDLTMKILLHVDRVQISFRLFEFRNIGKFGDYLVDNVSTENRENIKVSKDLGRGGIIAIMAFTV